jgi:hypothetical protein
MKALAAAAIALALTACSAAPSNTQPNSNEQLRNISQKINTTTTQAPTQRPDTKTFLQLLEQHAPNLYYTVPDKDLIDIGLMLCEFLDNGNTVEDMASVLTRFARENGYMNQIDALSSLAAASIVSLCPRHLQKN